MCHFVIFEPVSKGVENSSCAILWHRFQKMTFIFRGRRSTLDVSRQAQHFRRVVLRAFANRIVRAESSGKW